MQLKLLSVLPDPLRDALIKAFNEIIRNFRESRWEPSELNGGKLCEVVYSILLGHIDGKFPTHPSKPNNFYDSCKAFEKADSKIFSRSIRVQIPRMLIALYEIRNNRGVGHIGGDVNPNNMDSMIVVELAKWLMAELIRIFHDVAIEVAQKHVDTLVDRTLPIIWEVNGKRRVLNPDLPKKDQALLILYSGGKDYDKSGLAKDIEYSNLSVFVKSVLTPLHKKRLIDFDKLTGSVTISPTGIAYVEKNLPLAFIAI